MLLPLGPDPAAGTRSLRKHIACLLGTALLLPAAVFADNDGDALNVTVRPFAAIAVAITQSAPADVLPLARTTVAARLSAPVASLPVDVGDEVERGDVIVRLECDDVEDRLEEAAGRLEELEARRRLAAARAARTNRLYVQDAISADERDAAEAERDALTASLRSQRSTVEVARRNVGRCDATAPFAAVIDARMADVGEFVQPGTPLMALFDRERLEVRAHITGRNAATLENAEGIVFRGDGVDYPLTLRRIVPVEDAATRLREARLVFSDERPVPGSAGRIHWRVTDHALPADMFVRRDGRLGVMVADGDRARFVPVPAAIEGRPAPLEDMSADTRLIVDGRYAATDGGRIRVIENDGND